MAEPERDEDPGEHGELGEKGVLLSQAMRKATRNIHTMSDHLVNAKLGVTMSDDSVWAEGLLVFYEIFKFLEEALVTHSDSLIGDLNITGIARTKAIEADLTFYLGEGWQKQAVRNEVEEYLAHLRTLEAEEPYLLIPYVYHLFMALLSGGQVMKAKRAMGGGGGGSMQVLDFGDKALGSLKKQMKGAVNEVGRQLGEETVEQIIRESVEVFRWNNTIINSVQGIGRVLKRRLLKFLIALGVLALFFLAWWFKTREESDCGRAVEL